VAIGSKPEDVKSFLSARHLNTLRVALSDNWPQEFGPSAFPTTIVIDRFGQIQFVYVGQLADVGAILGKDLDHYPSSSRELYLGFVWNCLGGLAGQNRRKELARHK
jgi:hypothetical protein